MPPFLVRPYAPADRARVREICWRTGYMGEPVEGHWRDRESYADLFSSYYTDAEPESASVVEVGGEVAGYLLGCVDSRRAWSRAGMAARHALGRGLLIRPGTAGFLWRSLGDLLADLVRGRTGREWRAFFDPAWPAHLHIDLLPGARGLGAGGALMRRWLSFLRGRSVPGCHLQALAENGNALAFFRAMKFELHGDPTPAPGLRSPGGERLNTQVMVRDLKAPFSG